MSDPAALLRSPATIRERCRHILAAVEAGQSKYFTIHRSQLDEVARRVEQVTRRQYPDLRIPYHSRWRHFETGGVDRRGELALLLEGRDAAEQAQAHIDLTVMSVLLDAGAGPSWRFDEKGAEFTRSEGLGVATFRAFVAGCFSSDPLDPLRVDAPALQRVDDALLAQVFQVRDDNPLVGLTGRATLMRRLGDTLASQPGVFGADGRPGGLYDTLTQRGQLDRLPAPAVLQAVLDHLGPIWLTGSQLQGTPLGDCWPHPFAGGSGLTAGWVPFHKLSQWLTYSLLEPFEWAGVTLTDLDGLTGLPEYRNGGLLLDSRVIVPRDTSFASRTHTAADEAIVEWRALTVALVDELAPLVRERLHKKPEEMPLACILEGGTWAAGREIAKSLREGGSPPLKIESDGTVF
ncbi:URC4/urg3 family protein [Piscinibacter gummiphilus]|uniref:URC4/urg3 family protein n=1 Tax=Piscinibacter gummiphilus TaxID=946333 RepID=A0ABZ0D0K5_9BURK|nr:URC4/urg3 family protein [Piscinibacter gummiphilus]WOB08593.1 URC4/urg3 family protein [Piscinibacter gummiphilus]